LKPLYAKLRGKLRHRQLTLDIISHGGHRVFSLERLECLEQGGADYLRASVAPSLTSENSSAVAVLQPINWLRALDVRYLEPTVERFPRLEVRSWPFSAFSGRAGKVRFRLILSKRSTPRGHEMGGYRIRPESDNQEGPVGGLLHLAGLYP